MKRALLAVALLLAAPALAAPSPVRVNGAWVREAPPGAPSMAAYLTIENAGARPLELRRVTSPLFDHVEMHVLETDADGLVEMLEVPGFTVKPADTLALRSGGPHLMLMGPKRQLKAGDRVPLTLDFGSVGRLTIAPVVRRPGR